MEDRILVFIPCYNCAPQIGRVLEQFRSSCARFVDEVLVLDNGSRDGTVEAAIAAADKADVPRVTVARNRANYNLGGSHKAAYAYAQKNNFTHVVTLHGDDQGNIADLEPLLSSREYRGYDACLGARFARGSSLKGYSTFRIFGNHVFNLIFSGVSGRRVLDLGSGLNLVASPVFTDQAVTRHSDDLRFNIYLLLNMIDKGRRIMFFPITWREDDQVSNVKMASQALKTLAIARQYLLGRARFRSADHRETPHADYSFDPVATFENGKRIG